jgi:thiosulfate/3-mercaptopyruvate sulfurtransferase
MKPADALVEPNWVALHLKDPRVRIVDVRWYLPSTGRSAHEEYIAGHVPGATFVDLDHDLSAHDLPSGGRHPLPDPASFARVLGAHGISPSTHVVAYDDSAGSTAARLWWMLKQVGHARVSVLDGGLAAWMRAGLPVEAGESPQREPETYSPVPFTRFGAIVTREEVLPALDAGAVLLDARAPERFEGRNEPIDPRAGHIPGARNVPFVGNLAPSVDGTMRFLFSDALRARFDGVGAGDGARVILSCGSGVTACHNALAMHLAGFAPPAVYVGSWSDWSMHADLPIETGPGSEPAG